MATICCAVCELMLLKSVELAFKQRHDGDRLKYFEYDHRILKYKSPLEYESQ